MKPIPIEAQIGAIQRASAKLDMLHKSTVSDAAQLTAAIATLQEVQRQGINEISNEEAQALITALGAQTASAEQALSRRNQPLYAARCKLRRLAE